MNQQRPRGPPPPVLNSLGGYQVQVPAMNYPTMAWSQRAFASSSPFGYTGAMQQPQPLYMPFAAPSVPAMHNANLPVATPQQAPSSITPVRKPHPGISANKPKKFTCDACEKDFSLESQYKAHISQHVPCHHPGCDFQGSRKVVLSHHVEAHGSLPNRTGKTGNKKEDKWLARPAIPSLDSAEDIEKWRAERRKNWPTTSIVSQKEEERKRKLDDAMKARQDALQKKRKVAGNEDSQPQISSGGLELLAAYDSDEESGNTGDGEEKADQDTPDSSTKTKTRVCKYFLQRKCRSGQKCRFLHERKKKNPRQQQQQSHQTQGTSLLKKLLTNDIRQEHIILLQCIRYIVATDFLSASVEYTPQITE